MVSAQLVFLALFLGQLTLPTSAARGRTFGERRASTSGAVLLGNPDPPCEKLHSPDNSSIRCPEGWSGFEDAQGRVCLRVYDEKRGRDEASEICKSEGGELLTILLQDRENTVQKFLKGFSQNVWIGLTSTAVGYGEYFSAWPNNVSMNYNIARLGLLRGTLAHPGTITCFYLDPLSILWYPELCQMKKRFICDLKSGCPRSRFGDYCENECHCHGGGGCEEGQHCQYGCLAGWMGPKCCARKEKASVAYYCVNSEEQGRYMVLRIDPKNVAYDVFTAVDAHGQPVPWCQGVYQEHEGDGSFTLKVPVVENQADTSTDVTCPGEKVEQTGETYTWRIKLQEKSGIVLPYDRNLRLTCNFSQADTLSRGTKFSVRRLLNSSEQSDAEETIEESKADVTLEVVDPYTGNAVQQAVLGTRVALRMTLKREEEVMAQGLYPYNCKASSPNGELNRQLLNQLGCPVVTSPFSSISSSNGTVTTGSFPLFAFPGYWTVTITCSFDLCFADQSHCDIPCADTRGRRVKRESGKPGSHGKVTTDIHILPDQNAHEEDSASPFESKHSSAAEMMTPVTWFLLVTLVVMSALLIHSLYVRSAKQPIKSIRLEKGNTL